MEVGGFDVVQSGGVLAFAYLVWWLLKGHLGRIEVIQERAAVAQEKQAVATSEQTQAINGLTGSINGVMQRVEDLSGQVRQMREDLDELTPIQSPGGGERQAARESPGYRKPARGG